MGPARPAQRHAADTAHCSTVFSDLSERLAYNDPQVPIYARRDPISALPNYRCPCHWHRDLEFIRVVSGELGYFVNGATMAIGAGNGIVVNSSRLHYSFSPGRKEAWYECVVVSPALFESLSSATQARCSHAFAQNMDDFLLLDSRRDADRPTLELIGSVVDLMARPANPLPAVSQAIALCDGVLDRFQPSSAEGAASPLEQRDRMTILEMTGLIQRSYAQPLGLDDIAAAGLVSRSQCCLLFKKYVRRTPNEYLTERRLEAAKQMLADTSSPVGEIARACGFSSSSYFIAVFRKAMGATPKEYRQSLEARRAGL